MSQLRAIVDKLLTDVSNGYMPKGYISEDLFPKVPSKQTSGKLGQYNKDHLRIENSVVGGRGKYRRVETITSTTKSYLIEGHGLEGMVTKEDYRNRELPFDAEKDETQGLTTVLWLEKEKALADTLTSTAIITQNTTLAGADQYNDYLNSDPIDDFNTARATILNATGFMPDTAAMDILVWNQLRFHPQMLDALGYKFNRPGGLSQDELAVAMGVERILLAQARYNSAAEGQTASLAACWGKHIVFGVFPKTTSKWQTAVGYEVRYDGEAPRKVYKESNFNPPGSTKILVEDHYDHLIAQAEAAYLIKNAIA